MPISIKAPGAATPIVVSPTKTITKPESSTPSWLRSGAAANKAVAHAEAQAEIRREQAYKPFRFYIGSGKIGTDFPVIFLDGELDEDGAIEIHNWDEHRVPLNGKFDNFVCAKPDEICPICSQGDNPTTVTAFTIIDLTPYTIKTGDRAGQVIKNSRKLFVVKNRTLGQLRIIGKKMGGLRGLQMTANRTNPKAAIVGDLLTPDQQWSNEELIELLGKDKNGERADLPFNYEKVAPRFTAAQLRNLGFGSGTTIIGKEATTEDLSDKL